MMKLSSKIVTRRANKLDIVTLLSTKVEILAISQTTKEIIYLFYLMQAFNFIISEVLIIEYNNTQTISV